MPEKTKTTRREVIRAAVAVSAAGAAAAVVGVGRGRPAGPAKASGAQVPYGIIGVGSRGTFLLDRLKNVDIGRCVALCDIYPPNLDAAIKRAPGRPRAYRDYRELLADKSVEAVLVATPLHQHFPITRDALAAGKHVFCEKCLVFKPEEVHALRALCAERPRQVVQAGLQRRYSPFYQMAKSMVDRGVLGTVTHIRGQWHRNGSGRRPVNDARLERQINWRFYRAYSGGLMAELGSHAIDVADWMFGSPPEYVTGIGGIDYFKDGRETYDNVQLLFHYPKGQKLMYSAISTNSHLDLFGGDRPEFGEEIMGTGGTIQITIGDSINPAVGPALAMWYREPNAPKLQVGAKNENWVAGATVSTKVTARRALPLLLPNDAIQAHDSLVQKEMKYARRWLYSRGVMTPQEERNPVEISLEDFLLCVRDGRKAKAALEVGLRDSIGVMLSNLAMDEGRRAYYREIDRTAGTGSTAD
jgi:predicted dehydrogenase